MTLRFAVFMLTSLLVLLGILVYVVRQRATRPSVRTLLLIAFLIGPGGMVAAKGGVATGLPWWVFYPIPALVAVAVPPLVLHMNRRETVMYLTAVLLSAPAIHVVFSLFLGWGEYVPFVRIPSIPEMLAK